MKIQEQKENLMGLCKCTTGGKQRFAVQDDLQGVHEDKKPTAWANAAWLDRCPAHEQGG